MTRHASGCAALAAAAAIALTGFAATAAPAYVKSTVNLRSGPSTGDSVLTKIPGGSLVDATNCSDWCEVNWQGKTGYAIKSSLDTSGRVPVRPAARAPMAAAPYSGQVVVGGPAVVYGPPAVYYGYPYPYYRPFGYYRYRPYYGYRYGGWRRRW